MEICSCKPIRILFGFLMLMWPVWRMVPSGKGDWSLMEYSAPSSRCVRFVPVSSSLHSCRPRSHESSVMV